MIYIKIKEMAEILGLSESTVKKYYLLIENQGHTFKRTQQGQIMFSEEDVMLFRKLVHLKNQPGTTLSKAIEQLVAPPSTTVMTNEVTTDMTDIMKEMIHEMYKMKEQMRLLSNQFEQNQLLLESGCDVRDELLRISVNETKEMKEMLSSLSDIQEVVKAISSKQNETLWDKIKKLNQPH